MNANAIDPAAVDGIGAVNQEGENAPAYTFRKLNSTDTFLMFQIIGKIGINEFTACFENDSVKNMIAKFTGEANDDTTAIVGISVALEIANTIIGNLPKCEQEIYHMLSRTSDLTVEQVKGLDFATFAEMVIEFIKKEEFRDFISVVSRLFDKVN